MEIVDWLIPVIKQTEVFAYILIFVISILESTAFIGFFAPAGPMLVLTGFMAAGGYLEVVNLILIGSIGAIIGDFFSYWLGTKGTNFFSEEGKLLKRSHIDKAEAFFKRHGGKSIFLGRFIPLKPMIPFMAGLAKMKLGEFALWNILSAVAWAALHALVGYFGGGALTRVLSNELVILLAVIVVGFISWKSYKKHERHMEESGENLD